MVTLSRKPHRGGYRPSPLALAAGAIAFMFVVIHVVTHPDEQRTLHSFTSAAPPAPIDIPHNADEVKIWRRSVKNQCAAATSAQQVRDLGEHMIEKFVPPRLPAPPQPRGEAGVRQCKHVVMDFGANIGDTSGKVVDAGLLGCHRKDLNADLNEPAFNVETLQFDMDKKKRNPLTENLVHLMEGIGINVGAEDYCYYGVEGNPVFTQRLQKLEDFVMGMRPRPIQHLHFFTESVGAGEDGMTKLYLDTVNGKQNFWGSSIFKSHQDIVKSKGQNTDAVAADVMGYTIGTLMRKTLRAFAPDATAEDRRGGHFILKVDIEGGEYPLLAQAATEGTLCEYVKMGNHADLYIEWHSQKVTGNNPLIGKKKEFQKTLEDCGVTFRQLAAWWA